jgi:signal transduction histidine kinase
MHHYPFFRRMGCAFSLFGLFSLALLTGGILLVTRWLGLVNLTFDAGKWLPFFGTGFTLFVVLILALGGMGLRYLVVPLDDLLRAADRVGQGDYSVRVQEKGPREVRSLARAFNEMASRLHSLGTPLTVIQGNLEGILDGIYPADEANLHALLEETELLSRLVEDLRTLVLAESGALQLKKEPTDLALLVHETVAAFQTQADAAGVTLTVETTPDLPWLALDPGRIR